MTTNKRYMSSGALSGCAIVTAISDGDKPSVRFSETLFHPQGGGQKSDSGEFIFDVTASMGEFCGEAYFSDIKRQTIAVLDVRHGLNGEIEHFVDTVSGLVVGATVFMSIDRHRRALHTKLHSGGHLLGDAVSRLEPRLTPVQGHHWPSESRVEFDGEPVVEVDGLLYRLRRQLALDIDEDRPVEVSVYAEGVRRVRIGSGASVPCGGTHVERTGALRGLTLRNIQIKRGRTRIGYDFND